jgi:hypothetical protein
VIDMDAIKFSDLLSDLSARAYQCKRLADLRTAQQMTREDSSRLRANARHVIGIFESIEPELRALVAVDAHSATEEAAA